VESDLEVVGDADAGIPAISLARKLRPDVVVTDLLLPDLDGVAVTRAIRAECRDVQVVILSSVTEEDPSVVRAVRAGAIGYVVKDAQTRVLVQTIRSAANGQVHLSPRGAARLMEEVRAPNKETMLTDRQREVLREMAFGRTNKQIARSLHIGLSTVKCHVRVILDKFGVESRTQAALEAVRSRTLALDELEEAGVAM
jgi:DNA-binding NarL/FixJ family response regulator